jgi:hypothetical protein
VLERILSSSSSGVKSILRAGEIRLDPDQKKNGDRRLFPITDAEVRLAYRGKVGVG